MSLESQRRRFQFSLRWMLGALTVFAVLFAIGGYVLQQWNGGEEGRRRRRMNDLIQVNGAYWGYTGEYGGGNFLLMGNATTTQLNAVLKALGGFENQIEMAFPDSQFGDEHVKQIVCHRGLAGLVLNDSLVTDDGVRELGVLKELFVLELDNTAITDVGLERLAPLPKLRNICLWRTTLLRMRVSSTLQSIQNLITSTSAAPRLLTKELRS